MSEIVLTADGSHTLFVPEMNEHYHSVNGAVQESEHVYMQAGYDYCKADPLNIFEVGFGTGLNAFLTALRSLKNKRSVIYTAIEKYPLDNCVTDMLNYYDFAGSGGKELFGLIHSSSWEKIVPIHEFFTLRKINADLILSELTGVYDLLFFDAFGPDKQPEMWDRKVFNKIASITRTGSILTTYSSKGEVKRILRENNFEVALIPGPPGKREMIRATRN